MTADVTLEFLAKQQETILTRLGTIEDQITVLTGIAMRLDGSVGGLATEVRGMYRLVERLEHRVRKLEEHG